MTSSLLSILKYGDYFHQNYPVRSGVLVVIIEGLTFVAVAVTVSEGPPPSLSLFLVPPLFLFLTYATFGLLSCSRDISL